METEPETTDDPEDAEEEDGNNPEGFEWGNGNGEVPEDPGTEDSSDKSANKANKGTHIYTYDELNQLVYREDSQNQEYTYTYDKRGNRVAEAGKKESRAFVCDETNRLVEGANHEPSGNACIPIWRISRH